MLFRFFKDTHKIDYDTFRLYKLNYNPKKKIEGFYCIGENLDILFFSEFFKTYTIFDDEDLICGRINGIENNKLDYWNLVEELKKFTTKEYTFMYDFDVKQIKTNPIFKTFEEANYLRKIIIFDRINQIETNISNNKHIFNNVNDGKFSIDKEFRNDKLKIVADVNRYGYSSDLPPDVKIYFQVSLSEHYSEIIENLKKELELYVDIKNKFYPQSDIELSTE